MLFILFAHTECVCLVSPASLFHRCRFLFFFSPIFSVSCVQVHSTLNFSFYFGIQSTHSRCHKVILNIDRCVFAVRFQRSDAYGYQGTHQSLWKIGYSFVNRKWMNLIFVTDFMHFHTRVNQQLECPKCPNKANWAFSNEFQPSPPPNEQWCEKYSFAFQNSTLEHIRIVSRVFGIRRKQFANFIQNKRMPIVGRSSKYPGHSHKWEGERERCNKISINCESKANRLLRWIWIRILKFVNFFPEKWNCKFYWLPICHIHISPFLISSPK